MPATKRRVEPHPAFAALFGNVRNALPGRDVPDLARLREASFGRFAELGLPTTKAEDWKYTNIARFANVPMGLAPAVDVRLDDVSAHFAGGPGARRLIFVNGHLLPQLSHARSLPAGVTIQALDRVLEEQPERATVVIGAHAQGDERSFTALNAAFLGSGAWLELADGVALDEPVQLLFMTVGQPSAVMTHPRLVVRLGRGSSLHLIETHVALGEGHCLTNLVTQLALGADARLTHDRLQLLGESTSLIGRLDGRLADGARLTQTVATMGGGLVRNESELRLAGSGVECVLNGVYMPCGREHVDTLIRIHHEAPGSHSDQFYKGVVENAAHAVFAGKIIVHKEAQKTNAYQKNDNLLLSNEAELDTKPELEIYADDVKCSHGATCGDLDPHALFYLRSRGLDKARATSLLTYAFAGEVIERFADEALMTHAKRAAFGRLPGAGGAVLTDMP